jgi:hypothetical protein
MSTLTVKELAAPTGFDIKLASGETLDLNSQGSVTMPTGSVLQVVHENWGTTQNTTSTTSTSPVATGMSVSIVPTASNSKLLVNYSMQFYSYKSSNNHGGSSFIYRDGTNLNSSYGGHHNSDSFVYVNTGANAVYGEVSGSYLVDANSTSSTSFELYIETYVSGSTFSAHAHDGITSITVQEIAG